MAKKEPKEDWLCKSCVGRDGKQFKNYDTRAECRICGLRKGVCFLRTVPKPPVQQKPTLAEKQVRQQKAALNQREALKRKDDEIAKLKAELRKRQPDSVGVEGNKAEELSGEGEEEATQATDERLDTLREEIRKLEGVSGAEDLMGSKRKQLQDLIDERNAAKPMSAQLRAIERKLGNKKRALEQAKKEATAADEALRKAKAAVEEANCKVEQSEKACRELEEQQQGMLQQQAEGRVDQLLPASTNSISLDALIPVVGEDSDAQAALELLRKKLGDKPAPQPQAQAASVEQDMELDDGDVDFLAELMAGPGEGEDKGAAPEAVEAAKKRLKQNRSLVNKRLAKVRRRS